MIIASNKVYQVIIVLCLLLRPLERTINLYKDRAGQIGFQFKNGKINNIVKDSSAARNGVLTDHQLLEINGQNIVGMKDKQIVEIIAKASDVVTITIIPVSIYDHMIKKYASLTIKLLFLHIVQRPTSR